MTLSSGVFIVLRKKIPCIERMQGIWGAGKACVTGKQADARHEIGGYLLYIRLDGEVLHFRQLLHLGLCLLQAVVDERNLLGFAAEERDGYAECGKNLAAAAQR